MSDNLQIWNRFADIDPQFTKPITGKAYKRGAYGEAIADLTAVIRAED